MSDLQSKNFSVTSLDQYNPSDWSISTPQNRLAQSVLSISDAYNSDSMELKSQWQNPDFAEAYLAYFFPLNALRIKKVFQEARDLGLMDHIQSIVDFGSGPGTAHFSALDLNLASVPWTFIEHFPQPIEKHQQWLKAKNFKFKNLTWRDSAPTSVAENTLGLFSYSLNEISRLPDWAYSCSALMIIEPSLRNFGRNLQRLRGELIAAGFHIWAPCTHQGECPLLKHSESDWCHFRTHVELPKLTEELEKYLPMKNRTLTYSYLLASKKQNVQGKARVIGDTLYEKGKMRQAVCRNSDREFLSWLTRHGEPESLERGSVIEIPKHQKIGNELRISPKD